MPIYICPLSLGAPRVPVLTNEGITYDFTWIARSLLRENVNNNAHFNPACDPTTRGVIDTLIYSRSTKELNDALMEEALPLSIEEKTEIASLYTQLISRYPQLKIRGVHTLEGMQALISAPIPTVQPTPQRTVIVERLWDAAQNGHLPVVMALLTAGANIHQANYYGGTPLFIAAAHGHLPVVTALLTAGADINRRTFNRTTPLFAAADNGHLPVVKALLAAGANFNQAEIYRRTPLFTAADHGYVNIVEALLAVGADLNQTGCFGRTPLFTAVYHGHANVVTALLVAGADLNQVITDGLYDAVLYSRVEVVRALLLHQDITTPNNPLLVAAQNGGYLGLVRALLSDATVRDYYLNQIIKNPAGMRVVFRQNTVFFTELATHRNELWACLCGPEHFNLPPNEHEALLIDILNLRQEPNEALRHPLHTLFNTPLAPRPWSIYSFFSRTQNITLDDIQTYVEATYPQSRPSVN